jgi:hypothetical protein
LSSENINILYLICAARQAIVAIEVAGNNPHAAAVESLGGISLALGATYP